MPIIVGYYEGYAEQDASGTAHRPFPLSQIPSYFTHVPIAFCAPARKSPGDPKATVWEFDDTFVYQKTDILAWIKQIKSRPGNTQKILLSFQDTPKINWYPDVDLDAFAKCVAADIYKYDIDGIDIDAESSMGGPYVATYTQLIQSLRTELDQLQTQHPDISRKIISYTCYTGSEQDKEIIKACKHIIDYLMTMAYWDSLPDAIALFQHYAAEIGDPHKVGIGVKCPPDYDCTPLPVARQIATWLKTNYSGNMMLWSATRDTKAVSGNPDGTYGATIAALLNAPTADVGIRRHTVDKIAKSVASLCCCFWPSARAVKTRNIDDDDYSSTKTLISN